METVLIVSSSEKGREFLTELLIGCGFERSSYAANGGEARRILLEQPFDLVVINAPLQDEFGHELALSLTQSTDSGILMLVKAELADAVSAKVEDTACSSFPVRWGASCFSRR